MKLSSRLLSAWSLSLALLASTVGAAPSVVIDGRAVSLPTLERDGKVYVDAEAFARALGATVTFDRASGRLVVTRASTPAGPQGEGQLAGGEGRLGQAYAIGQRSPLNFTLRSAAYSVRPVALGPNTIAPNADEKLLVLRYRVQNPQKGDVTYYWGDLKFTAVDAQDGNHTLNFNVAREGTTEHLQITLKPAQAVDVVAVLKVPANAVVPKLLVERGGESAPILRYDLRGQVTPLPAPFAEPAGRGEVAREVVPGAIGTFYPMLTFDFRVESAAYAASVDGRAATTGRRFLVVTASLRNPLNRPLDYYWGTVAPELRADGGVLEWNRQLLRAGGPESASGQLRAGDEVRVRYVFEVGAGEAPRSLTFKEGAGRAYTFDLSGVR